MAVLGILICIASLCGGVYLGGWIMFIGGIVDIIDTIKDGGFESMVIALGVVKILAGGAVGTIIATIGCTVGCTVLDS